MTRRGGARPPRVAEGMVALLAPASVREDVLGDLHEHYLANTGAAHPALAYWREALRCLPALAWYRLERTNLARLAFTVLACALAYISVSYWDVSVARRLAASLAAQPDAPALLAIRVLYFLTLFLGATVAGAAAAVIAFRRGRSFFRNALATLSPLVVLLSATVAVSALSPAHGAPITYLALRLLVIVTAMVIGAYATARLTRIP
ncbi:MAG: hypothetical protein AAF184_25755 [Pseudomonadota bacterium]